MKIQGLFLLLIFYCMLIFSCNHAKQEPAKPLPVNTEKKDSLKVPKDAISGDFNGDGKTDYAWLKLPVIDSSGLECVGSCTTEIVFSDPAIPSIKVENSISGELNNLGDLNSNQTDELGNLPGTFAGCWSDYHVYTLKENKWIHAVDPFPTHCNQWEDSVKAIVVDSATPGNVKIIYSEHTGDNIITRTKSVKVR